MKYISKSGIFFRIFLLGQLFELHAVDWVDDPEQPFPPCCGDGLLHDLDLCLVPPPQDKLQLL